MSGPSFCWWCRGDLYGPGGVKRKEPLFFTEVEVDGNKVRMHMTCAKRYNKAAVTAQESDHVPRPNGDS